ncbi:outer membrane protein assembly factor BamD [Flavobacteriaceae bacterium R38]|nr:outer membrane protein assembly factor BamD [Flavobacteriaceae bacterium R38]
MVKKQNFLYIAFAFMLLLTSCSEYQRALKNDDIKVKYALAEKLYNEGEYKKALRLFEQIVPKYIGKPQGERVIFFYADSYYKTKDYYLSGFRFEQFTKSYPNSDRIEEAAFLGAKSYYYLSPKYSIDQTETYDAIEKLQVFINEYPNSERLTEANTMVKELTTKLEKKAYEIAKQFNKISDHYAAIKSFELFLQNNAGTIYKEDAMFYRLDSSYKLAVNSVFRRKEERLKAAQEAYNVLMTNFAESKYAKQANEMSETIKKELEQFSK